jgi:hypothetical protein
MLHFAHVARRRVRGSAAQWNMRQWECLRLQALSRKMGGKHAEMVNPRVLYAQVVPYFSLVMAIIAAVGDLTAVCASHHHDLLFVEPVFPCAINVTNHTLHPSCHHSLMAYRAAAYPL